MDATFQPSRQFITIVILLTVSSLAAVIRAAEPPAVDKIAYWDIQRRGANGFCARFNEQWFIDLKAAGIGFCRLAVGKQKGTGRDFLLGDADEFRGIPPGDLKQLLQIVDWAAKHEVKLVVVPLSLPGARWAQQNGRVVDKRLWTDEKFHQQAAAFWKELAAVLRDKPAVVGYEILNEPAPERALGAGDEWAIDLAAHQRKVRGTPADVNVLYRRIIAAIREVDAQTPVVLSSSFYGFAGAVPLLEPVEDKRAVYSFHTYEPYAMTNFRTNQTRFRYPTEVPTGDRTDRWDRQRIEKHVAPVAEWATKHGIPAGRIFVGEFGCDRRVGGVADYLADSIAVFNQRQWHWAFYAFREDEWDAMDYELGDRLLPWAYWQAIEKGESPAEPRTENTVWRVIREGIRGVLAESKSDPSARPTESR